MLFYYCPLGVFGKNCSQGLENGHRYVRQNQTNPHPVGLSK